MTSRHLRWAIVAVVGCTRPLPPVAHSSSSAPSASVERKLPQVLCRRPHAANEGGLVLEGIAGHQAVLVSESGSVIRSVLAVNTSTGAVDAWSPHSPVSMVAGFFTATGPDVVFLAQRMGNFDGPANMSPDGQHIVYRIGDDLYVDSRRVNRVRKLGNATANYHPRFSPNGQEIAYFAFDDTVHDYVLRLARADTAEVRTTDAGAVYSGGEPHWSLDGRWVYVLSEENDDHCFVIVDSLTGKVAKKLACGKGRGLALSPDQRTIVRVASTDGESTWTWFSMPEGRRTATCTVEVPSLMYVVRVNNRGSALDAPWVIEPSCETRVLRRADGEPVDEAAWVDDDTLLGVTWSFDARQDEVLLLATTHR